MFKTRFSILIYLNLLLLCYSSYAQVNLRVRINSGNASTTCTDSFFGGSPEPHYRVNISNQGFITYPARGICYTNTPNTQFNEIYNCPDNYPSYLQICLRAFEDDGNSCVVNQSCLVQTCQTFATPTPGSTINYTLNVGGASSATINFTIIANGSFQSQGNDLICNAINLGTQSSGTVLGNSSLSNYNNRCAADTGEPNPWGNNNDQGVWFQFTTGTNPSSTITIDAKNDPQNIGDAIDLQLALYESSNNLCYGSLTLIEESYLDAGSVWDEQIIATCLKPNSTYFLLVDGQTTLANGGQEGFFGLEIIDSGIAQAADLICDAEFLGQVPDGGTIGTPTLSRSNTCASSTGDPVPNAYGIDKGVWFQFQAPNSGRIRIQANSDLSFPVGTDAVDLQLAVFGTDNGTGNCNDSLNHLNSIYTPGLFNETLYLSCLNPSEYYWVLVDGSAVNTDGIFDITISDTNTYDINTWNGTSWSRGAPNMYQQLVISGNYNSTLQGNLEACNLTIATGGELDVQAGDYVNVVNDLTVNGDMQIRHEGSFTQENNSGTVSLGVTGKIDIHKTTTPLLNWYSYTYWSSPVADDTVGNALSNSHPTRRHVFLPANFADLNGDGIDDNGDDWRYAPPEEVMTPGVGYVACAPTTETYPGFQQSVAFNGRVNNGIITTPISIAASPETWNIIGNPYPSAIDSHAFVAGNTGMVDNTFYLWTHNSDPIQYTGPYGADFTTDDYATYNTAIATGIVANSGGTIPSRYIASCQSFLIRGLAAGNATFNNSMRVKTNNNSFFKTENSNTNIQRDLIWLNLKNDFGAFKQVLIGFVEGANDEIDMYDSKTREGSTISFYSLIENKHYSINGREPLVDDQEIPLGFTSKISGTYAYEIEIDHLEGHFDDYDIYLEDKVLSTLHDLRLGAYNVVLEQGTTDNRFALVIKQKQTMSVDVPEFTEDSILVYQNNNELEVVSRINYMKQIRLYDTLGKQIFIQNINTTEFKISADKLRNAMYIVAVTLENNQIIRKKFIKR